MNGFEVSNMSAFVGYLITWSVNKTAWKITYQWRTLHTKISKTYIEYKQNHWIGQYLFYINYNWNNESNFEIA